MGRWIALLVLLGIAWWLATPAARAQVYRCTSANGAVSFQDHACRAGQRQQLMDVAAHGPDSPAPVAAATQATSPAPRPAVARVRTPPPPLPTMYACVGAVNGKHYLAHTPPPPYLAPLGVAGYPSRGLAQAYGRGGASMSAPEGAPPVRVRHHSAAGAMTEVQDACVPAPPSAVCHYVQQQYDANRHALNLAMPHEAAPLEARARALAEQLRNC